MPLKDREAARRYNRERRHPHRSSWLQAMHHRIESQRDLAAYLRRRGNLHCHWVRRADSYGWQLIYLDRSPLCGTERCVMIPLRVL